MTRIDVTPYVAAWRERRKQEQRQLTERLEAGREAAVQCAQFLAERYGVRRVYLFGSMLATRMHIPQPGYGPQTVAPGTCHRSSSSVATWTM